MKGATVLPLVCAVLIGFSVSGTSLLSVAAQGTPAASPVATPKMPAYLAGNADALIPAGTAGALDLVVIGPLFRDTIPIIIRNNTQKPLVNIQATAIARDPAGTMLAVGMSQLLYPDHLLPGEVSLAYVYFQYRDELAHASFTLKAKGKAPQPGYIAPVQTLSFTETALRRDHLVGILRNDHSRTIAYPGVYGICFAEDGAITGYFNGNVSTEVEPGSEAPFDVPLWGTQSCTRFVVAAAGFTASS
jgi:hypothetical protein